MDKGQTIQGLIERAGKYVFSKDDTKVPLQYVFKIFIWTFYPLLSFVRHLTDDLRNVALSFLGTIDTRTLNLSSSDPDLYFIVKRTKGMV